MPSKITPPDDEALSPRQWLDANRNHSGGCLIWSFGFDKDGHPILSGTKERAHRTMARKVLGPPRGNKNIALRTCGNGACVSPSCLKWVTRKQLSKLTAHNPVLGEDHYAAQITDDQAAEVKAKHADGWPIETLARRYKVTAQTISQITRGKTWKHVEAAVPN